MKINLKKLEGGTVLVWPGTILEKAEEEDFKTFLKDIGCPKVNILGTLETLPDVGCTCNNSGGRNDLFFEVFNCDTNFWLKRLEFGMRLLGDVLSEINGYSENPIYGMEIYEWLRDEDNFDK